MSEVFIAFRLSGAAAAVLHDFSFAEKKKNAAPENFMHGSTTNLLSLAFILFNLSRRLFQQL